LLFLVPGGAKAAQPPNCLNGQPLQFAQDFGAATIEFSAICKGAWVVDVSIEPVGDKVTVEVDAVEDSTGKECHTKMVSPTGGFADFKVQKVTCTFTKGLQIKFSVQKQ
jgi:hypothetical protein